MIEWFMPMGVAPQAVAKVVDEALARQPVPAQAATWGMSNPDSRMLPPPATPRPK